VTAAQVLTSGLKALSGSLRPTDVTRLEKAPTSFRDMLDSASRSSSANAASERASETARAPDPDTRDYATKDPSEARDDRTTGEGESGTPGDKREDEAASTSDQPVVTDLSAMLAALNGSGQTSDESAAFKEALAALRSAVAEALSKGQPAETSDKGPALPGSVDGEGETFDPAKLLALLNAVPDATETSGVEVGADVGAFTATVLGQETHLALETSSQARARGAAETQELVVANGAQAAAAAVAEGAVDGSDVSRGRAAGDAAPQDGDGTGVRRGGQPSAETRYSVGGAFADQGIAGQEGRQQESGGSSGGNSQQSSTGVFASMVAGARSQAVQSADEGDVALFDPLSEQIAAEVRAELRADGMGESSSDGVVKVLHLQLKPANLGEVTVRIALRDNTVTVHLEAQHRDTLAVIERERDALANALASAGYSVDGITAAPQSDPLRTSSVQTGLGDQGSSASQGQANQGQGPGNSSGEQGRQARGSFAGQQGHPTSSDGNDSNGNGARGAAGGLYV
jgi:chemotaxis protein MotD